MSPTSSRLITDSGQLRALASPPRARPGLRRCFSTVHLRREPAEIFDFFSNVRNLEAMMPPDLQFAVIAEGEKPVGEGAHMDYAFTRHRLKFHIRTRVTQWDPPFGFIEEQVRGPFSVWHHAHGFTDEGDRVRMDDEVIYRVPFWPLGAILGPWLDREVSRIMAYRRARILEVFGEA